jgi:hypothetical protein
MCAGRGIIGRQDQIVRACTCERSAAEIHRILKAASENDFALAVDGDRKTDVR